ncbi:hypothetical protein ZWY2020_051831 [Hordeum vulgare]|nr:hypothetical protein ZWY2020_051831 [Hordeum vulgare]
MGRASGGGGDPHRRGHQRRGCKVRSGSGTGSPDPYGIEPRPRWDGRKRNCKASSSGKENNQQHLVHSAILPETWTSIWTNGWRIPLVPVAGVTTASGGVPIELDQKVDPRIKEKIDGLTQEIVNGKKSRYPFLLYSSISFSGLA